jgi:flagellar basal-body rod protein FlgF
VENATYAALTRQFGLWAEMRSVANNVANAATTGYRSEGVMFSEYVADLDDSPSLSMAAARVRETNFGQGALTQTGGPFDLAIEGEGFFMVLAPQGERLTRAGSFTPNAAGDLVTPEGYPVLDPGGAPVFVPQGVGQVGIASDGTLSADGQPVAQIGIVRPLDPQGMLREDGVRFAAPGGYEPVPEGRMVQGFLEEANVDSVREIARMIEVSRAYELGQSFLTREDERIRAAIRDLSR